MANYMTLSTNKMKEYLVGMYRPFAEQANFVASAPVMLWGQPGIGKSELVTGFANTLGELTGKQVHVQIISLLLMMPTDLRGIPAKVTTADGEDVARWLAPEIFKLDSSEDVLNILFFDELSAAPQTVQAAAYQITNERHIGEHCLPDNALVIAAGNRVTDQSVAYKMPKALGNRLIHFEVQASVDDWKTWAYTAQVDERIIGFVSWKPDYLNSFDLSNEDVAYATPRSWNNVSKLLRSMDIDFAFPAIAGTIGLGLATEFKAYVDVYLSLPKFDEIASGKLSGVSSEIQKDPAKKYAIVSMIASNMKFLAEAKMPAKEKLAKAENVGKYMSTFSDAEYKALCQKDTYAAIPADFRAKLLSLPSWDSMLAESGQLLFN